MRISAIRLTRLETGAGYNNRSAAVEVTIDEHEDVEEALNLARNRITAELNRGKEIDRLAETLEALQISVHALERTRDSLRREIAELRGGKPKTLDDEIEF